MLRTICALLSFLCAATICAADVPFDYFQNSWSVIGLKDYQHGTRITPRNELLLAGDRRVRFRFGRDLVRLSREQVKTNLEGWLPIVQARASAGPVRYEFTFWATPLPDVPDWQAAYHWPVAGENYLNWVIVEVLNSGSNAAPARLGVERVDSDRVRMRTYEWDLQPGQSQEVVLCIPFEPLEGDSRYDGQDPQVWLNRTRDFWRSAVLGATRISVPCVKSNEALLAAHVCQLIANDHGEVHGGEGFYDRFYIRDGAYQVMEFQEAGMWEAARLAVRKYLEHQRPDGRFESQKGQFDANGQALWVLWQHYRITGDQTWLEEVYPAMRRAVNWLVQARRQTPSDSPFAGLLPNALADGEYLWDGQYHIVGYDLWNLRGLLCTADAARILKRGAEFEELMKEAESYRAAIDAACRRTGVEYLPPSWELQGTPWGNTETLWPTELFAPDDPRVTATIREVRERHGGGFHEGTIRWTGRPDAIHPYMSAYTTMADLVRGEHEQVVEDYYWYLLHSSATHAFAEGIFFKRRFAWADTIPHVTGACNFAILLRHMLVHETARVPSEGNDLHLLAAVPDWWLADGREIAVERAPTHFGPLSLRVTGRAEGVRVEWSAPTERPPSRILLHLPRSRPLIGSLAGVEVVYREPQSKRWDFPTVVGLYEPDAPPLEKPIPDLVDLPLENELPADRVELLDLSGVANTDPFTAPFGVKNVGKLVFAGLPVGRGVFGGVPFQIVDPGRNDGRGLVVLHSSKAPADVAGPRQVIIPVGRRGTRLFFLGNVSGWGGTDPGVGEWGAVAEYIIEYADEVTQTVPLITGRTIEDWTAKPAAMDVFCGLRGDPWHLNVMGVRLRPVAVERIVFHDLGTPAAPLLAAITLESRE